MNRVLFFMMMAAFLASSCSQKVKETTDSTTMEVEEIVSDGEEMMDEMTEAKEEMMEAKEEMKEEMKEVKEKMKEAKEDMMDVMKSPKAIDLKLMDANVKPGDDFFKYVNGNWLETAEIPADRTRWGSFDELRKKTDDVMLEILHETISADNLIPGSEAAKVADFYNTIMDTVSRNRLGIKPIQKYLSQIDAIDSKADVLDFVQTMESRSSSPLFGFSVFANLKNSKMNVLHLGTGALGLPEREFYMSQDEDSKKIREDYVKHVARMLQFLGQNDEESLHNATHVLDLETQLAEAQLTKEESRDARKLYHFMPVENLSTLASNIEWRSYLDELGYGVDSLNVLQPEYIKRVSKVLDNEDLDNIKSYLKWCLIDNTASYLSMDIDRANFDFFGKRLNGLEQQRPLNERALSATSGTLGEALGQLYVAKVFPPEAKKVAKDMVDNIVASYRDRINNLEWMSDETKVMAQKKLNNFTVKIAYPDKWKDYSMLKVGSSKKGGSYLENIFNRNQWNFDEGLTKVNKPVDKSEWGMTPQTVNAYYHPLHNEIVFPAAILQPPFFNFEADAAVNYGGIGAVIGHEISHGFDDSGSRFDADGNLKNWWTESDRVKFDALGKKLAKQYDAYEPLPGVFVNGTFTLGENIGDLGGIYSAYDGLQRHLKANGRYDNIDGFTPEQRFFLSWGTIWRTKQREAALKNQIKTDPHSPGMYRANGPIVNMQAWYDAFDVQPGNELYKPVEERILIW